MKAWSEKNRDRRRALMKEWNERNRDHKIAYMKEYNKSEKGREVAKRAYLKNRDAILAQKKIYYLENREEKKAATRLYRAKHRSEVETRELAYRVAHREEIRARARKYQKDNLIAVLTRNRNRRARQQKADGHHTAKDIAAIRKAQNNRCAYCAIKLGRRAHLDHIVAIASGGSNWPRNLQWLCQPCNNRKSAKDPIVFARENGLLL